MKYGYIQNIYQSNPPSDGLTISSSFLDSEGGKATYFALGKGTDISKEMYQDDALYLVNGGTILFQEKSKDTKAQEGEAFYLKGGNLLGEKALENGGGYLEFLLGKDALTSPLLAQPMPTSLKDLVPYTEGSIVNCDLAHSDKMKFVLMAFSQGESLSKHRAPGEALVIALDGEGTVFYEGTDYPVKPGDIVHFAKGGLHAIKADKKFKMALFLTLK